MPTGQRVFVSFQLETVETFRGIASVVSGNTRQEVPAGKGTGGMAPPTMASARSWMSAFKQDRALIPSSAKLPTSSRCEAVVTRLVRGTSEPNTSVVAVDKQQLRRLAWQLSRIAGAV